VHTRFAKCADGFRIYPGVAHPENLTHHKKRVTNLAAEAAVVDAAAPSPPPTSEAERAREDLRALIAGLPEDSPQRKSMALLLERDEARAAHDADEKEYQTRSGSPDARLPLPTILRERNEKRGRALLGELDRVLADAQLARDPRAVPPREEVMLVKETLAGIPAKRDAEDRAVRDALQRPAHMPGGQDWICREPTCGKRFTAGTLDQVRRKAKAEPGWRFVCPHCGGMHVELFVLELVS